MLAGGRAGLISFWPDKGQARNPIWQVFNGYATDLSDLYQWRIRYKEFLHNKILPPDFVQWELDIPCVEEAAEKIVSKHKKALDAIAQTLAEQLDKWGKAILTGEEVVARIEEAENTSCNLSESLDECAPLV